MKTIKREGPAVLPRRFFRYILLISILIPISSLPASAVDFVTEEEFSAERSTYKDYPLKILFKKLAVSEGTEKEEIRNLIILKQAFDRTPLEGGKAGVIEFQESFGIVKGISADVLKLWIPEKDSLKDYHVGIGRVPLENDNRYDVTESNIDGYASTAYTLDGRVYKLKIDFMLTSPTVLHVERGNGENILTWKKASTAKSPSGYRLFLNGKPYKTVEDTTARIPRQKGRVDNYYVKAVYQHGNSFIESRASVVVHDDITANEMKQELLAKERYERALASIGSQKWEEAEEILNSSRQLIEDHLDQDRRHNTETLISLFRDIDGGDRLSRIQPKTMDNLETALRFYRRAEQKAKTVPANVDILSLAEIKIDENLNQKALLETRNKEILARDTYDRIIADLKSQEWDKAGSLLQKNRQFITNHLDPVRRQHTKILTGYFIEIDEGDRMGLEQPNSIQGIESALTSYRRAEEKAKQLPEGLGLLPVTERKIEKAMSQKALLETRNKELLAKEAYDRVTASFSHGELERTREILNDNQRLFEDHLDRERRQYFEILSGYFKEIDKGDRIRQDQPESIENIETALGFYRRAEEKALELHEGTHLLAVVNHKIEDSTNLKKLLEMRNKEFLANERYDRIIVTLKSPEWENARKLLYDNQDLFKDHLDPEDRQSTGLLAEFFQEIDKGDRLSQEQPETARNLGRAIRSYRLAEQKTGELSGEIDVQSIVEHKIREGLNRKALLEVREKERLAGDTYDHIIAALESQEWDKARRTLYDNMELITEHPSQEYRQNAEILTGFFRDVDKGNRLMHEQPDSIETVEAALVSYRRARERIKGFSAGVDLGVITEQKIRESLNRSALLETKNREFLTGDTYDRIIAALNPEEYEKARKILYDNRQLLEEHLDENRKKTVQSLIKVFQDIDEGDQLSIERPETARNLGQALRFYKRAEQKAEALLPEIDIRFITELKIRVSLDRKATLEARNEELQAQETYNRIVKALRPLEWEKGKKILETNRLFLEKNLGEERKKYLTNLLGFFHDIDEGDRMTLEYPDSEEGFEAALTLYKQAEQKAGSMPGGIDVRFISDRKIKDCQDRKNFFETRNREQLARDQYDHIINYLSPDEWEGTKKRLIDNRQLLTKYLDKERKEKIVGIIAFLKDIEEGDRFSNTQPVTEKELEAALTFYKRAGHKAEALPEGIDLLAVAEQKIDGIKNRLTLLKTRQNELLVEEKYEDIIAAINSKEWKRGRRLLIDNWKLMSENLDEDRRDILERLVAFFQDIEGGDWFNKEQPVTEERLEKALSSYRQAAQKAEALPEGINIMFIAEQKIKEVLGRKALMETRQKKALAAEKAGQKSGLARIDEPDPAMRKLDRKAKIQMAMEDFDARDYKSSMDGFIKIFSKQIGNIQKGGKQRVRGILGLPVECRAEIIFLIELDRLKRKNRSNDKDVFEKGLENIDRKIEDRRGLWVIIRDEGKLEKIRRHIALFDIDSLM